MLMWHRLSTRLILSVVLVEIVMLSILVWNSVRIIGSSHAELLENTIKEESVLLVNLLAPGLMANDYALIADSLSLLKNKHGLVYMEVHNHSGEVVASIGKQAHDIDRKENSVKSDNDLDLQSITHSHTHIKLNGKLVVREQDSSYEQAQVDGVFDYRKKIEFYGQYLGEIHAGYSIERVHQLTDSTRLQNAVIAAIELILTIVVTVMLGIFLTRNLRKLEQGAQAFGQGELQHRIQINSNDEIGDVARSFNLMAQNLGESRVALEQRNRELQKSKDELEERVKLRTEDYLRSKEEAESANLAKSIFLSSMSHELRTPLNAILGFAQLLRMEEKDEMKSDSIQEIVNGGNHLLALINELLDLSKIESGNLELSIANTSLNKILNSALSMIKPFADEHSIQIDDKVSFLPDININVDETRFKQVLLNILSNAIKYNSIKGKVTIDCSPNNENMLYLSVTDTGKGLTPEQLSNLFKPFERFGAENSHVEGTGLGLVISKNLIEKMGGKLKVESEIGKGSCFWIQVPLS